MLFEAAELGRKVSKDEFQRLVPDLVTRLLAAQRALRGSNAPVIVIVSGVEGAGKGEVVNRLNQWLDARGVRTYAFWDESDEERERPRFWRFWRALPPRGTVGVMFGSWYSSPIIERAYDEIDDAAFDRHLARIAGFERMLTRDGALIVKLWFHLSKKAQRKRLRSDAKEGRKTLDVSPLTRKFSKRYDDFAAAAERAILKTDTGDCPWYVIEAEDRRYRDLSAGETLLQAVQRHLERGEAGPEAPPAESRAPELPGASLTILDKVDLSQSLDEETYERELAALQERLYRLAWKAWESRRNAVAVFEGWDAAGKGGAIRRVTRAVDARLYRVIQTAAPSDEERAHHYLWRFWRQLPRGGHFSLYDRSWYGRVLVERVEGFATAAEWMSAYEEINDFEEQLCEHGMAVMKFWLHISQDEQMRRFREREATPWKAHKITEEDWRNRARWAEYEAAANDMVARTSTSHAPWTLVAGDDKRFGRVQVLRTFCERLEAIL